MRIVVVEDNELYRDELLQCLEQEESDIDRHPDAGDGWIRDDRSPAEKKDILQNCDYKFLSRISVCKTCNGAWCR